MSAAPSQAPRVIALAGPTASGKTDAALALAARFGAEIISVDSALVYRGMDIGTAKPSADQLAAAPHHLIDIRDPRQAYSAAEFAADATRLVSQVNARGRLALLVGGTMLYFKALFEGLDAMPAAHPEIRAKIEAEAAERGWPALHAELAVHDPVTAARLAPADAQRIQRALEVLRATGRALSSFHATKNAAECGGAWRAVALFSLEPEDRSWLHERIARRFDAMLASGFLDEVRSLRARGDLHAGLPSMRCVGYRQAWEFLDAREAHGLDAHEAHEAHGPAGPWTLQLLRDRGIFATRQLARRQLTWLRGMPQRRVIACDRPDAIAQLLRQAAPWAA
jgi:tRNA dimethylallyltransferase